MQLIDAVAFTHILGLDLRPSLKPGARIVGNALEYDATAPIGRQRSLLWNVLAAEMLRRSTGAQSMDASSKAVRVLHEALLGGYEVGDEMIAEDWAEVRHA